MDKVVSPNPSTGSEEASGQSLGRGLWYQIGRLLIEPASSIQDWEERRQARLLASLLVTLMSLLAIGAVSAVLSNPDQVTPLLMGITALCLIPGYILSRTERHVLGAAISLAAFSILPFAVVIARGADSAADLGNTLVWIALPLLLSNIFLSLRGTTILAALNIAGVLLLPVFIPGLTFAEIGSLLGFVVVIAGALLLVIRNRDILEAHRRDELLERNRALQEMRDTLEDRVAERMHDLEQRSRQVQTAFDVGRAATLILNIEELIWQVAELIGDRFDLYHVGLFLVDDANEWAVYRAGAGAGGRELWDEEFRLQVGGDSMVGWCTTNAQSRVAHDVTDDDIHTKHELVPATRSEAALPLIARGQVIGALSVQSDQAGTFDPDTVAALQTMADQVAVAIANARLFQQTQESLEAERRAYGELSRAAWGEMVRARPDLGYRYREGTVEPVAASDLTTSPEPEEPAGLPALSVPVMHRGQVFGAIEAHKAKEGSEWTPEEQALMQTLAEQLSVALESARLYQDTQRRAAREQLVGQVTSRLRETLDLETVLRTAAEETRQALGVPEVVVRLRGEHAAPTLDNGQ